MEWRGRAEWQESDQANSSPQTLKRRFSSIGKIWELMGDKKASAYGTMIM